MGRPSPEPELKPIDEPHSSNLWVWHGFWRLSNRRPHGLNGVLRIPVTEIEAYCDLMGWDSPSKRRDFLYFVEAMDEAFMEHVDDVREQKERQERSKITQKPQRR